MNRLRLLFIEDDEPFFHWLKASMGHHDLTLATNIEAAEKLLAKHRYDATFIDLHMPFHIPSEVVARARAANPSTPLVILTGMEMRCDLAKICDGFMYKGALTDPELEIPHAVKEFTDARGELHRYDHAAQMFNAVRSLRHASA